ncbi:MBL fold metallo-hydrolase [Thermomicrobium sp. 4228-Ro]|uniref:MBL fold metallo-hydrolase n=1 Tax=Thermomicrobium sp. 4228-Ro TaxID=2993937 RepID=UPI0022497645|nr:MBL fold metallo-hydrolase [Thermomicrobium sp. 4228-Ro]MCX2728168.1 MBL fold metallo-hydrolase [Thermomicrobium sp. 4228-Ro]
MSKSRFIALPVGQGDAFYLETDAGSVLVDGGRSAQQLPDLFCRYVRRTYVDILIVTHNDSDHVNGILGFLESKFEAGEIWLPGRFVQVLPHLVQESAESIVLSLLEQASLTSPEYLQQLASEETDGFTLLERYGAIVAQRNPDELLENSESIVAEDSGWPPELLDWITERSDLPEFVEPSVYTLLLRELFSTFWYHQLLPVHRLLAYTALRAAERIRRIALAAFDRGIPIRWFQYDPKNPSGGEPWLQPVSAREISRFRPVKKQHLFEFLALTQANRESLVFWVPPDGQHGGVLFTGDSRLDCVTVPAVKSAIATAPHHGSKANEVVYEKLFPAWWVRSDGRFRSRPCQAYRSAPTAKACTVCRAVRFPKQPVIFQGSNGAWLLGRSVRRCSC